MKATRVKMSIHAREERLDRLTYIAMNVGFGDTVFEAPNGQHPDRIDCLTDTGVLIIKGRDGTIITAYIPTMDKVIAIYRRQGITRIPTAVYNKVRKNEYHVKMCNIAKY